MSSGVHVAVCGVIANFIYYFYYFVLIYFKK